MGRSRQGSRQVETIRHRLARRFPHPGRTSLALFSAATLALTACGKKTTSTSSGPDYTGKTIKLGAVLSLTGAGAIYGPQQKKAIELAKDQLNASKINGAKLSIDIRDDGSDKAQGAQQFQDLIQQGQVDGIIGPTLSNTALGAHPVADTAMTPVIAPSNTGNGIVGNCPYDCKWIFRDSLGEAAAIPANLKVFITQHSPKTVALAFTNDDKFSSDGAGIFKTAFAADGISEVDEESFPKATTDFSSYVTKMIAKHPDFVVISGVGAVPPKFIVELRTQKYTGPIIGGNGFNSSAVATQAGTAGLGAQSGSAWFLGTTTTVNTDFVNAYKAKYNANPDQFAAQAYTAVELFAAAAKKADLKFTSVTADRSSLKTALEGVSLNTPLGPFSFTSDHDVRQPIYVVAMDGNGGFTLVSTVQPA